MEKNALRKTILFFLSEERFHASATTTNQKNYGLCF